MNYLSEAFDLKFNAEIVSKTIIFIALCKIACVNWPKLNGTEILSRILYKKFPLSIAERSSAKVLFGKCN